MCMLPLRLTGIQEYEVAYRGSPASSAPSVTTRSSPLMEDYETDEEIDFLRGRARRMHTVVDTDPNTYV